MAQHTDPGSIPIGARPLRVEDEVEVGEEEAEGLDKNDEVSVQSACLLKRDGNGIDTSIIVGKGIALDDDEEEDCSGKLKLAQGKQETLKVGGGLDGNIPSGTGSGTGSARIGKKKVQRRRGIRRCRKCGNNYKPPRSHHDSVTGRCISKFDHYCPWVGNAVGAMNHKFFVLFIFYTFLSSLISLYLITIRFIRCGYTIADATGDAVDVTFINDGYSRGTDDGNWTNRSMEQDEDDMANRTFLYDGCAELYTMNIIALLVMSICFLVFTCCMLFEQVDAIESNTSKIARMKVRQGQDDGEYQRVATKYNEMFGVGIGSQTAQVGLHWYLPTPVQFPDDREKNRVLGYEFYDLWQGRIYQEEEEEEAAGNEELGSGNSNMNGQNVLAASKSEHGLRNGMAEIELPAGNGNVMGRTNQNGIYRRSSSQQDNDMSDHSSRIV